MITWKRWKKVRTKFENLRKLGALRKKHGNGLIQATGIQPIAGFCNLTNARFEKQGYLSLLKYYLEVRV